MKTIGYFKQILDSNLRYYHFFLYAMGKNSRYIAALTGFLMFTISLRVANAQIKRSQQQHANAYSSYCLVKSPKYDGECTRVSLSAGTDSVNIHFFNNETRILSFIIDKADFRLKSDG